MSSSSSSSSLKRFIDELAVVSFFLSVAAALESVSKSDVCVLGTVSFLRGGLNGSIWTFSHVSASRFFRRNARVNDMQVEENATQIESQDQTETLWKCKGCSALTRIRQDSGVEKKESETCAVCCSYQHQRNASLHAAVCEINPRPVWGGQ